MDLEQVRRVLAGRARDVLDGETVPPERRLDGSGSTSRCRSCETPEGEPRYFIAVVEDISERKRAEEALRTSEARLAAGADLAGLGFYEVEFDGGVMYSDDRLRELCGVPADRTSGLEVLEFWAEHLHPDDRPASSRTGADPRRRVERLSIEYRYRHPRSGSAGSITSPGTPRARTGTARARHLRRPARRHGAGRTEAALQRPQPAADPGAGAGSARSSPASCTTISPSGSPSSPSRRAGPSSPRRIPARGRRRSGPSRGPRAASAKTSTTSPTSCTRRSWSELGLAEALRTECDRRARQGRDSTFVVSVEQGSDVVGERSRRSASSAWRRRRSTTSPPRRARSATVSLRAARRGSPPRRPRRRPGLRPGGRGPAADPRPREHARARPARGGDAPTSRAPRARGRRSSPGSPASSGT